MGRMPSSFRRWGDRVRWRLVPAAFLIATTAAAQDRAIQNYMGPSRYCGYAFAVDLTAGDRIEVERGPDFMLEGLVSQSGGFGLYEGSFPQNGTGDQKVDAGLGKPTYRVGRKADDYGYVIWAGDKAHRFFVHVWGMAFKGSEQDYPLLRRLEFGEAAKRGCPKPTFQQSR